VRRPREKGYTAVNSHRGFRRKKRQGSVTAATVRCQKVHDAHARTHRKSYQTPVRLAGAWNDEQGKGRENIAMFKNWRLEQKSRGLLLKGPEIESRTGTENPGQGIRGRVAMTDRAPGEKRGT